MKYNLFLTLLLLCCSHFVCAANKYDNPDTIVVARDGTGEFRTVTQAIEVCRAFMDYHKVIYVKKGTYKEKVIMPQWLQNVEICGEDRDETIITYDDHANLSMDGYYWSAQLKEQLLAMGIKDSDIDAVLLTHLDCDHANGLKQVKNAKKFLVAADEVKFATKITNKVRYYKNWWKDIPLTEFEWNDNQGPVGKSYDLLGDGSIELINIPGHADGLFAVKVKNEEGKFVLLFSDGGYARKSWEQMITSGIAADKEQQKKSLAWIREQSLDENCVESLANHDPDIQPHVIEL